MGSTDSQECYLEFSWEDSLLHHFQKPCVLPLWIYLVLPKRNQVMVFGSRYTLHPEDTISKPCVVTSKLVLCSTFARPLQLSMGPVISVMWCMVEQVDPMFICLLLILFIKKWVSGSKVGLFRILWQCYYKPVDSTADKDNKSMFTTWNLRKEELLSFPCTCNLRGKLACLQVRWLGFLRDVILCFWLTACTAGPAMVRASLCCWSTHIFHACHHGYSVYALLYKYRCT